ncbi:MAG: peptidylprolyl isomerase [Verrucomicrobia bacterium]|nr:MAG: peptidylprolyl isomerase [Verrucomicrobiota bacterium]
MHRKCKNSLAQTPSSKHQTPSFQCTSLPLVFEIWSFLGVWCLMFGVCFLVFGDCAFPCLATDKLDSISPAPDKARISYALGMNLGLQRQRSGAHTEVDVFMRGLRDVLEGRPTKLQESEVVEVLNKARAGEAPGDKPAEERLGYAMGMKFGLQLKRTGADVDAAEIAQGLRDVAEGKPTRIKESDLAGILKQGQEYSSREQSRSQKAAAELFFARNAKEPGVTVLPDGLQYRVLQTGTSEAPSTNDLIFIKYRGTFVDGREFDRQNHYLTRTTGGIKGWQEALQKMKVGSKWQIFVPPDLAFGHEGEAVLKVAPDSAVIYELELLAIAHPGDPGIGTGRKGHGLGGDDAAPLPTAKNHE